MSTALTLGHAEEDDQDGSKSAWRKDGEGRKWDREGYHWKDQHLQKQMNKKCCAKPATKDQYRNLSFSHLLVSKRKEGYSKTTGLDTK